MKKCEHLLLVGVILNILLTMAIPATIGAAGLAICFDTSAACPGTDIVNSVNITRMKNFDACNYDINYDPSVINVTEFINGFL